MIELNWWTIIVLSAAGAAIGSTAPVLITKTGTIIRKVSHAFRWGWHKILALRKQLIIRWRERKAQTIIERNLEGVVPIYIRTDSYHQSLREPPATSRRSLLGVVKVDYPTWLNDYYVANALEALSAKGLVVKANQYGYNAWPPQASAYFFRHGKQITSASVEAEVRGIETDSMCSIYQTFFRESFGRGREHCSVDDRFEHISYAKTLSHDRAQYGTTVHLKGSAPPCERCWERHAKERPLRSLVGKFLENELSGELTSLSLSAIQDECTGLQTSGESGPFIESVVSFCVESGVSYEELPAVLDITRRAIAIYDHQRKEQSDGQVDAEELKRQLASLQTHR